MAKTPAKKSDVAKNGERSGNDKDSLEEIRTFNFRVSVALGVIAVVWPILVGIAVYLLSGPVSELLDDVKEHTKTIQTLKDTPDRLDKLDERLREIDRSVAGLQSVPDDVRGIRVQVTSLEKELVTLNKVPASVEKLEMQFAAIAKQMESATGQLGEANTKVVLATTQVEIATKKLDASAKLLDDLKTLPERVKQIEDSLVTVSKSVDGIAVAARKHDDELGKIGTQIAANDSDRPVATLALSLLLERPSRVSEFEFSFAAHERINSLLVKIPFEGLKVYVRSISVASSQTSIPVQAVIARIEEKDRLNVIAITDDPSRFLDAIAKQGLRVNITLDAR